MKAYFSEKWVDISDDTSVEVFSLLHEFHLEYQDSFTKLLEYWFLLYTLWLNNRDLEVSKQDELLSLLDKLPSTKDEWDEEKMKSFLAKMHKAYLTTSQRQLANKLWINDTTLSRIFKKSFMLSRDKIKYKVAILAASC